VSDSDEPASDSDEPASDPKSWLRQDLDREYYALLDVISKYDGWLLIVKGWSVTLSLAALGIGFNQRHYVLFAIAAVTGAAFWYLDGLMKGFQYRYYVRMREIEYTAYLINSVTFKDELYGENEISAPRIDMTWDFKGFPVNEKLERESPAPPWWRKFGVPERRSSRHPNRPQAPYPDYRASKPWRREPEEIYWDLRRRFSLGNVMLPHVVAVVVGSLLFFTFLALNIAGVDYVIGRP
jgi:hypothetical protein